YGTASFSSTYRLDGAGVDVTLLGKAALDNFGRGLSSGGDVNGDGFNDLVIGAYQNNDGGSDDEGAVYILYGHPNFASTIRTAGAGADVTIVGKAINDFLGRTVSDAGDVNGDGFDDIIMGAYGNNDGPGANDAGAAYILYGSASLSQNYDIEGAGVNVTLLGKAATDSLSYDGGGGTGPGVSGAGDINRDGFDDIISRRTE
ncbi:MAG: integrin alpha, partial [Deltaproteobacteria bacterium]